MTNAPYDPDLARKNARLGLRVLAVVLGMVGLSFASVPLYSLFCKVTGFDGTTQVSAALPDKIIEREMRIQFNADTGQNMPWSFKPEQRDVTVKLGQKGLAAYHAHNPLSEPVAGTAVYNVTPLKVGKYFHKIQCFCFSEQILAPGQDMSMPVLFFVDPALDEDPDMRDVKTITLSYTFYRTESEELDRALEAFYNAEDRAIKAPLN
jgi:cytochrome c oxidase assembly protein subunit 11